jgi:hypothetical protein
MKMVSVSSRAIAAIGYDPATRRMRICFHHGETYNFCDVPEHVFQALKNAWPHPRQVQVRLTLASALGRLICGLHPTRA